MTVQERIEHQNKMRSFKTYDACKAYQQAHQTQMKARAKENGSCCRLKPGTKASGK